MTETALSIEDAGGGAWRQCTGRLSGQHPTIVSYTPKGCRTVDDLVYAMETGDPAAAFFTWYEPGQDVLALTNDECDTILEARDNFDRGGHGELRGGIRADGPGVWAWRRLGAIFAAANFIWWRTRYNALRMLESVTYEPTGLTALPLHCDWVPEFRLSMVAMLSDRADYEGAQLTFRVGPEERTAPQERGTVVVFPSTTMHYVTALTGGVRHIARIAAAELPDRALTALRAGATPRSVRLRTRFRSSRRPCEG